MMTNKRFLIGLTALSLLLVAGFVSANDLIGDVNVTTPHLTLSNLVIPANVNPTETITFSVDMSDVDDIINMKYMDIIVWHESVLETSPDDATSHYSAHMWKGGVGDSYPAGWAINATDIQPHIGETFLTYEVNGVFSTTAKTGTWNVKMIVQEENMDTDTIEGTFIMNSYMNLEVQESSFSFGDVQQGMMQISISDPTNGYLTIDISCNMDTKIQVSGTDPTKGVDSFAVSNILVYDADDVVSASLLSNSLTDLNGVVYNGMQTAHIYLWINVPASAPIGVYTFTFTIVITAV